MWCLRDRSPRRPALLVSACLAVCLAVCPTVPAESANASAATVWAVDDGEKIGRDATALPFETGVENPVWRPGEPIRLIALRDEVVALQIVVEADAGPLDAVIVDASLHEGPQAAAIRFERFIEVFFEIKRPSSGADPRASLGWVEGSGPPPGRFVGWFPDALIPVEIAPAWAPWPMRVQAGRNGVVWIDLTVPPDQPAATYRGEVIVRDGGGGTLATLPLELEVLPATMPARPVATMLYYSRSALDRRIGDGGAAERQLWTLFHQHRVAPVHGVASADDVRAQVATLDGSFYAAAQGYRGPAEGVGDGIVVLGTYGALGDPTATQLAAVERIADELAAHGQLTAADVVLYAEDEDCASARGAGWRELLARSPNPNARQIRVAWTCSEDPARQPVDVPIVFADAYDTALAAAARAAGRETWIYNGRRPATGTMLTDTEAVSMRTIGWIAAMAGIPRWFIWHTTSWYDGNPGGHGAYDPFVTAETFHNSHGEASMGDGVLVYPGRQADRFSEHSLGFDGVIPSIRLKNLRRGIQDAGYLLLARGAAPADAERIARALLPRILAEARPGAPPAWSERGKPFFDARRALARLIAPGADPGPAPGVGARPSGWRFRFRWRMLAIPVALVALIAGVLVVRRSRAGGRGVGA